MGQAVGDLLPFAIGVAVSPLPIVAVIVLMTSVGGKAKGVAFAAGWVLALAVVGTAVLLLAGGHDYSPGSDPSHAMSVVKLVLGVFLLLRPLRVRRRARAAAGTPGAPEAGGGAPGPAPLPGWLTAVDKAGPGKAAVTGALLAGVNPKNLILTIAAAAGVAQSGISGAEQAWSMVVFVALASVGIVGPVLVALATGSGGDRLLGRWRAGLIAHNEAILTVLFVVFGVVLVGKGIAGLTA